MENVGNLKSLEALTQWVNDFTDEFYRWALYKVSNSELAKDLVQDTFLSAAERIDSFKGNSSPKTWLFSILNNKIIDHYRKKVHQSTVVDDGLFSNYFEHSGDWHELRKPVDWHVDDELHLLDDSEFQHILKECLDALPEKWSTTVKLKYLMEKGGEEICQELGITPSNFWQIVHRAKLQLRECVEKNWYN